jgi:signal transduction histidine kinase
VALRDHGFAAAVDALAQSRGREQRIEVTLDVALIDSLGEQTQAALYQIVREALEEAIRRGPPSRFEVAATADVPGTLRLVIRDDAPTERRRRALEVMGERGAHSRGEPHTRARGRRHDDEPRTARPADRRRLVFRA